MKDQKIISILNQTLYGYTYKEAYDARVDAMLNSESLDRSIERLSNQYIKDISSSKYYESKIEESRNELSQLSPVRLLKKSKIQERITEYSNDLHLAKSNEKLYSKIAEFKKESEFCNALYDALSKLVEVIVDTKSSSVSSINLPEGWYWVHRQQFEQNDRHGELVSPKGNTILVYNVSDNSLYYNGIQESRMNMDIYTQEDFDEMAISFIEQHDLVNKEKLTVFETESNKTWNQWVEPLNHKTLENILIPKLTQQLLNASDNLEFFRYHIHGFTEMEASQNNDISKEFEKSATSTLEVEEQIEVDQVEEMEL